VRAIESLIGRAIDRRVVEGFAEGAAGPATRPAGGRPARSGRSWGRPILVKVEHSSRGVDGRRRSS
ncbi:MAG: hypothetical protein ACREN5_17160, partial [Gemmatimonadales bacterium]